MQPRSAVQSWSAVPAAPAVARASATFDRRAAWLSHPVAWHVAFWSVGILNELVVAIAERRSLSPAVLGSTVGLYAALALPAYVNIVLLVPRLARHRRYAAYSLALLATCAATALGFIAVTSGLPSGSGAMLRSGVRLVFTSLMFTGIVAALDLGARHVRAERQRAESEREHAERRLEHLKAQLNPHFLFNTLNSLYALAIARSAELPELILKHAALLRYVLYGADVPRVPLSREIEFVADYVELERLRLDDSTDVRFEVEGVVGAQEIAPLLLVPLVENCFKHLGHAAGECAFVHITLTVTGAEVRVCFENSREPAPAAAREDGGIGLRNTRERLALRYPGRHALVVRETPGVFSVELVLQPSANPDANELPDRRRRAARPAGARDLRRRASGPGARGELPRRPGSAAAPACRAGRADVPRHPDAQAHRARVPALAAGSAARDLHHGVQRARRGCLRARRGGLPAQADQPRALPQGRRPGARARARDDRGAGGRHGRQRRGDLHLGRPAARPARAGRDSSPSRRSRTT